jgi:hypothetical protein
MPAITDKKPEKGFTLTTMKLRLLILLTLPLFAQTCKKNKGIETIPTAPVSLTIDLNLPSNQHLNVAGGHSYFTGGVNGVLVIHDYDDNWYAFERTCAYQPLNACSNIWMDTNNVNLRCGEYESGAFKACCESRFMFNGFPSKGPAQGRLAQYKIQRNGNTLFINN